MKPKIPPSIEPGGFFGGRRQGFLIATFDRSSLIGVVELETMRGKGERAAREIVEGGLEERSGEGTNDPSEGGLGESCGPSTIGEEDEVEGKLGSQAVRVCSRL